MAMEPSSSDSDLEETEYKMLTGKEEEEEEEEEEEMHPSPVDHTRQVVTCDMMQCGHQEAVVVLSTGIYHDVHPASVLNLSGSNILLYIFPPVRHRTWCYMNNVLVVCFVYCMYIIYIYI